MPAVLARRQVPAQVPSKASGGPVSAAIVGSALGGLLFIVTALLCYARRKSLSAWWKRRRGSATTSPTVSSVPLTATDSGDGSVNLSVGTPATNPARGQPRPPRRYNQRQDSGISIRSIPGYTVEPADEELVLVKAREEDDLAAVPLDSPRPSFDVGSEDTHVMTEVGGGSNMHLPLLHPPSYSPHSGRSRSASEPMTPQLESGTWSPLTQSRSRLTTAAASSTLSLALPSHRTSMSTEGLPPSSRRMRMRESFYGLSRPMLSSSRRLSSSGGAGGNASSNGLAGGNVSSTSLIISDPLPSSFARSSYIYPRAGLTAAQMSFISSRESLSRLGVYPAVGDAEPPAFESPVEASASSSPFTSPDTPALMTIPPSPVFSSPEDALARSASVHTARDIPSPPSPVDARPPVL